MIELVCDWGDETRPLRLRPWRRDDKTALVRYADNYNVWRTLRDYFPHPYTETDAKRWIAGQEALDEPSSLAIVLDGEPVGGVGHAIGTDVDRCSTEVGYWVGEPLWGRGIATAALRVFADHLFVTQPLTRLFAGVYANNPASARVLEKAGFEREALLRRSVIKEGQVLDMTIYARTREPDAAMLTRLRAR